MMKRLPAEARTPTALAAAGLGLLFIVVSAVWLGYDHRVPNGDSGRHLNFALIYMDRLRSGFVTAPITLNVSIDQQLYPPLVHLVGSLAYAVGGIGVTQAVMAQNLIFVPLLALGCYGAGTLAFGRRAGLLAVVFALGMPMIIALFHEFMLDTPQAALVAVSVWLLLLSQRFERTGVAVAAGVVVALATLSKQSSPIFVAGPIAVMLVRGGWRNWRGWVPFALVFLVLVEPWYSAHLLALKAQADQASAETKIWYESQTYPTLLSARNFAYYGWAFVNFQAYLPLAIFFAVGLVWSVVRWARLRSSPGFLPELVVGAIVSYLAVSVLSPDDPRYLLPAAVYAAVLGTAWISQLTRVPRLVLSVALGVVAAVNMWWASSHVQLKFIDLPGPKSDPVGQFLLTVLRPGYDTRVPERAGGKGSFACLRTPGAPAPLRSSFSPSRSTAGATT